MLRFIVFTEKHSAYICHGEFLMFEVMITPNAIFSPLLDNTTDGDRTVP